MASIAQPLIGMGTSLLGGILGSSAAKKAGKAQADGAYTAGSKILSTSSDVNRTIGQAETAGNGLVSDAATAGKNAVIDAGGRASNGVLGATSAAVDRLTPYSDVGQQAFTTLGGMVQPGGALTKEFTGADMESLDPGYQFRIDQAMKAIQRSAAARGGVMGGGALKSLNDYVQNTASSEFGNAFSRFDTNRKFQYGALSDVAKTGLQAGEAAGQLDLSGHQIAGNFDVGSSEFGSTMGLNGAEFQAGNTMRSAEDQGGNSMKAAQLWGEDIMGAGNALASGYMGAANAWSSALNGVGEAASGFFGAPGGGGGGGGFIPYSAGRPFDPSAGGYSGMPNMPTYSNVPTNLTYLGNPATLGTLGQPVAPPA